LGRIAILENLQDFFDLILEEKFVIALALLVVIVELILRSEAIGCV
jgi:hypothetical protein